MRLIDADALVYALEKRVDDATNEDFAEGLSEAMLETHFAPTVTAVPVVRCRDCKYCHIEDEYEAWCYGGLPAVLTRAEEDFCSHGQRREVGVVCG